MKRAFTLFLKVVVHTGQADLAEAGGKDVVAAAYAVILGYPKPAIGKGIQHPISDVIIYSDKPGDAEVIQTG